MEAMKFRTNIKCSACVAKVTPHLNETVGEQNWEVDINDPQKTLTIKSTIGENDIRQALERAGYRGEKLN